MVTAHDADLVALIADRVEKVCNYRPDEPMVKSFLDNNVAPSSFSRPVHKKPFLPDRPHNRTPTTERVETTSHRHSIGRHGSVQFGNETYNSLNEFCKAQGIKYNGMRTAYDAVDRCLDARTGEPLLYRLNVTDENGRPVHYDDSRHIIVNDSGERVNKFIITKVDKSSSSP